MTHFYGVGQFRGKLGVLGEGRGLTSVKMGHPSPPSKKGRRRVGFLRRRVKSWLLDKGQKSGFRPILGPLLRYFQGIFRIFRKFEKFRKSRAKKVSCTDTFRDLARA